MGIGAVAARFAAALDFHGNAILATLAVVGIGGALLIRFFQRRKRRGLRPKVSQAEIRKARRTIGRLDAAIDQVSLVSARTPSQPVQWVEPPADVIIRVDAWRAEGDTAVHDWPEFRKELAAVSDKFPRWHAKNIGERNDVLISIRTTLRLRYGLS